MTVQASGKLEVKELRTSRASLAWPVSQTRIQTSRLGRLLNVRLIGRAPGAVTWAGVTCPARVDAQPQAPHLHGPRPSPPLHPCAVPGSEHPRIGAHHVGIPTATPAGGQPPATQPAPATTLNPRALEPRSPACRGAGACTPGVPSPGFSAQPPGQRMSSCGGGGGGGGDGAQHPPPRGRTPILPHHSPQPTPQRPLPHPHQPKKRKKGEKGGKKLPSRKLCKHRSNRQTVLQPTQMWGSVWESSWGDF